MKRYCLQNEGQLEPQKFFNQMATMSDLPLWIDPAATTNSKLANYEIHRGLTQSINSSWELEAKNGGFLNDRIRFF